jgi:hypothetical protein
VSIIWFGVNIGKEVRKVVTRKELGGIEGSFLFKTV